MVSGSDQIESRNFDVLIIGGGPAGLAAAIWCSDLHLSCAVFDDGPELGGQLGWIFNEIRNYPGINSISANDFRMRIVEQVQAGSAVIIPGRVIATDLSAKTVQLSDGRNFTGRAIIIATGIRRRHLGLPGELELAGKGILKSGVEAKDDVTGRDVVIVGGGDAALENAAILSQFARRVTVVNRNTRLKARSEFVEAARDNRNVQFIESSHVTGIIGDSQLVGVELTKTHTDAIIYITTDRLLVRIGVEPNTELFAGQLDLDAAGFICVSADMSCSQAAVFAVGDVAIPNSPTLSTAAGTASIAAKSIRNLIVSM